MTPDKRICFVSMEVYPILKPGVAELAGGAGFQVVQLARGLKDRGFRVSFVVGDFGQDEHEVLEGFDVYRSNKIAYDKSITRGLTNLWRLFRAMRRAGAGHYVLRSIRFLSFFVMLFSRLLGAKYTFMVASRPHCIRGKSDDLPRLFAEPYAWSVKLADRVTTQTEEQHALFLENFGVRAPVVPNGIEVPVFRGPCWHADHDVSWVGSFKAVKRADRLIEFAKLMPTRKFLVAGGASSDLEYYRNLIDQLAELPNVTYLGFVNPDRVGEVYEQARLHLNTSDWEGFPNAFLYAWTRGVPTCSLNIDPDGLVTGEDLGIVEPEPPVLAMAMDALLEDEERYLEMAHRCYDHVLATNASDRSVDTFVGVLP